MRVPTDLPPRRPRRSSRGRLWIVVAIVAIFILLTSLRSIAGFYTDYLWFKELHVTSVFRGILGAKILLAVVFTAFFFLVMWANLTIADRIAPRFRTAGAEDEIVQRYREVVGPHAGKVRIVASALFALFAGVGTQAQWNNWILFSNGTSFHDTDAQFHKDLSFYVFRLPFINFIINWFFVAIVITTIVTVVAHYLNGGIRVQAPADRVTPQVKAHISVLLGALAVVKGLGYWFERYQVVLSTKHVVDGATYTDVHAELPAKTLLIVIAGIAAVLFIYNIREKGWTLPLIAVALWGLVWILVGGVYPAFIQSVRVKPSENVKERPYITRNIAATRKAFGIDNVQEVSFAGNKALTPADIASSPANQDTISNIRLLDPNFVRDAFTKLQEIRSYYVFNDLDVDRYTLNGKQTQTLTAIRELNQSDVPSGFVNQHLQYTHGMGAVVAPANQSGVGSDGTPNFTVSDVPPTGVPDESAQPRVYYGEGTTGYVIVKSGSQELDYQSKTGANIQFTYSGTGGVPMGSIFRRIAFAFRFGDLNPVISGLVHSNSRIMYIRNIRDRVHKVAPFLHYDSDPYAVILNGRIFWIQDAYTITNRYPYSQHANTDRLPAGSGLNASFNYVRNSVKVMIDAYNGSMRFYVMDPKDPIVATYAKAFPKLFTPASEMDRLDPGLRSHLRYPEDLFRVQTNMYGRYHILNAGDFYNQANAWTISQDPGSGSPGTGGAGAQTAFGVNGQVITTRAKRMDPTYLLTHLSGEAQQSFLILQPFVPVSPSDKQQNLTAVMTAKSDPSDYGKLEVLVTPPGQLIDGPALINSTLNANKEISQEISLLNQQGSQVKLGNVVVVPIGESLLYVQPLYVQSQSNPLPLLRDVLVVYNGQAVHGPTIYDALCQFDFGKSLCSLGTGGAGTTPTTTPGTPTTPTTPAPIQTVAQLLTDAQTHFNNAQNALKNGDLATYQKEIGLAQDDVNRAQQLSSTATTTAPPPATTTTTAPSSPPSSA
jgi:uncharacterized protein